MPRKLTLSEMREFAASKGGKCLSREYVHSRAKLKWQCHKGHQWKATAISVRSGFWCHECARQARLHTIDDMNLLAQKRGGKCCSDKYVTAKTPLEWECAVGHKWSTPPAYVKNGSWCPRCAIETRKKIKHILLHEMRSLANKRGGKCLSNKYTNSGTHLEWECAKGHRWKATPDNVKHRKSWCPFCSGRNTTIAEMQVLAAVKGGRCLSAKYVNGNSPLKWQCANGHTWKATSRTIINGCWCRICSIRSRRNTIEQMQEIASTQNGKCLSKEYFNSNTPLEWECKEGHRWKTSPASIKMGHWCPVCAGVASSDIKEMHLLAELEGGVCLSQEYVNASTPLLWQCYKGHKWRAIPHSIKRGSWCPRCANKKPRKVCD